MNKFLFKLSTLSIFIIFILSSCQEDNNAYKLISCKIESSIDTLPDSTFMSGVIKMQIVDNYIYFIEKNSRQLIKLDIDFNNNERIGQWGMGPQELVEPRNFFIFNNNYYIIDIGAEAIKEFSATNKFISSNKVKSFSEQRVFVNDEYLYMAFFDRGLETCFSRINITNNDNNWTVKPFGNSFDFGNRQQNIIRNKRELLHSNDYFYSISDNIPVIEKYNIKSDNKVESFDYSFVPIIKDNLEVIKSKIQGANSYIAFVRDAYIHNDDIYILVSRQGDEFTANTILQISLEPSLELISIYQLPGEVYSTFCIYNNFFYAFNNKTASIEKIVK